MSTELSSSTNEIEDFIAPPIKYRALKRYFANKATLVSTIVLFFIFIFCYFPSILTHYPQNDQNLLRRRLPPSSQHWFGTDTLGRDVLTELLHAGQVSLRIAIGVALLSTFIGAVLGAMAGYYGKWLDSILMRITDLFLIVPQLVILMLALHRFGGSDLSMVLIVSFISWMYTARIVRSQVMTLRNREFIDAAKISGRSGIYIILRYLIPNSWSVIAVSSAFSVAGAIALESVVSFLGYGIQAPQTSWGRMLYDFKGYAVGQYFYLFLFPSLAIFITILSFNFISDGLRDALDPRSEQS